METCSALLLCCGTAWWRRKPGPQCCLQRSEQGGGGWNLARECPRPLPGESKQGGGSLVPPAQEHVCPWRNWNTFWYFQCILGIFIVPELSVYLETNYPDDGLLAFSCCLNLQQLVSWVTTLHVGRTCFRDGKASKQ